MRVNDAESLKVAINSKFNILDAEFQVIFFTGKEGTAVSGEWINRKIIFKMNSVTEYFEITLPECFNFELFLETVRLRYSTVSSLLDFKAVIKDFGALTLASLLENNKRCYTLKLEFQRILPLNDIPIIGQFCDVGDGFAFKKLDLKYRPDVEFTFSFISQLIIKKIPIDVNADYIQSLKPKPKKTSTEEWENSVALADESVPKNTIYWLEINKGFSVLFFSKIGVSLNGSELKLYLDASFSIAFLRMDFYELYVSTSLKKLTDIGFGIGGLMVTMEKPSFSLTGGLYKSQEEDCLYNGTLGLRIGKYSFQALGSYGEMPGSGEKTFFAYLMLGMPLGGPPYFFVTGLAFGFGVNRSLKLPELNKVRAFPLVAAAMGESEDLKPNTSPKLALSALSKSIVPTSGQYFISAGIRVLTFGVLETFLLLNVEMGNRLVISLLGLANASIPPKVTGTSPIMRAELAVKAVIDPQGGEYLVMAALTDRSFLFDPSCKLTGGFAIGFWLKGEHKGDFIVTIGGCHNSEFHNVHYPEIPPLGVSWIINRNISIKGEAYFALTPTCMMAGASLKLLFEMGNLKAWFFAAADFILKWKPFFYQARGQVSVGVSYRISLFGIGKTFKVEMGAGLTLWGPEFSGKVRINWYIISFSIGFGAGSANEPQPIKWGEFADSFIPEAYSAKTRSLLSHADTLEDGAQLSKTQITGGLIAEYEAADGQKSYVIDGFRAAFLIEQKTPCSDVVFNGKSLLTEKAKFGIVPMNLNEACIEQHVTITYLSPSAPFTQLTDDTQLNAKVELRNVPSALWGIGPQTPNSKILKDMPMGMTIEAANTISIVHILPEKGAYEETVLSARESITRIAEYRKPIFKEAKVYPIEPDEVLDILQTTIENNVKRDGIMAETSSAFSTWRQARIRELAVEPRSVLLSVPELLTLGSEKNAGEWT